MHSDLNPFAKKWEMYDKIFRILKETPENYL